MFKTDWWVHIIEEIAIFYQFYYMVGDRCSIDNIFHDMATYCWNEGCWMSDVEKDMTLKILYMTRSILDAIIVWYEGIPNSIDVEHEKWQSLSRQTGKTIAEIVKEITNFKTEAEMKRDTSVLKNDVVVLA